MYKRLLDLTPSLAYMPVIPVCMRIWMFLSLFSWPVAESSQNWSALPIALSWVWHQREVELSFLSASLCCSWCLMYIPGWFGERRLSHTDSCSLGYTLFPLPAMLLREAERFLCVFQSSLFQIQCCCWQFQDSSEGLAGAAGLSPALLCPRHGTSPFIQGARPKRGSRGKAAADPTEPRAEASDLPQ